MMIAKRINTLYKNEKKFDDLNYQKALINLKFKYILKYTENITEKCFHRRQRIKKNNK